MNPPSSLEAADAEVGSTVRRECVDQADPLVLLGTSAACEGSSRSSYRTRAATCTRRAAGIRATHATARVEHGAGRQQVG